MTNGPFISDDDDSSSAAMLPPPPETSSSANSTSTSHLKHFNNEKKKKEEIADETLIEQPKKSSPNNNNNNNNNNNTTNSKSSSWVNGKTKASLISLAIVIFVLVFAVVFLSTSKKVHSPSVDDGESAFRREFLRNMTREAWNALMMNNANSTSSSSSEYDKHRGQAIVTAMSTLHLMSLTEEFEAGKAWIAENLSKLKMLEDIEVKVLLGDYLGGLLSTFALTNDYLFKEKALEVLKVLEPAFNSPTGLLYSHLNLKTENPFGRRTAISWIGHQQPELIVAINFILSSGKSEQQQRLLLQGRLKVIERFVAERMTTVRGLYMHIVDVESGAWLHPITTLGSRGIDFYYNLLRAHLLLRKGSSDGEDDDDDDDDDHLMVMATFVEALEAVIRAGMLRKSTKNGLTYALEYNLASESYAKAMATSACRLGGMLALASSMASKVAQREHKKSGNLTSERMLELAISLTETCYQTANSTATKLLPLELWTSGQISNSNRPQSSSSSSSSAALGSFNG